MLELAAAEATLSRIYRKNCREVRECSDRFSEVNFGLEISPFHPTAGISSCDTLSKYFTRENSWRNPFQLLSFFYRFNLLYGLLSHVEINVIIRFILPVRKAE